MLYLTFAVVLIKEERIRKEALNRARMRAGGSSALTWLPLLAVAYK